MLCGAPHARSGIKLSLLSRASLARCVSRALVLLVFVGGRLFTVACSLSSHVSPLPTPPTGTAVLASSSSIWLNLSGEASRALSSGDKTRSCLPALGLLSFHRSYYLSRGVFFCRVNFSRALSLLHTLLTVVGDLQLVTVQRKRGGRRTLEEKLQPTCNGKASRPTKRLRAQS